MRKFTNIDKPHTGSFEWVLAVTIAKIEQAITLSKMGKFESLNSVVTL